MHLGHLAVLFLVVWAAPLRAGTLTTLDLEIRFDVTSISAQCFSAESDELIGNFQCGFNQGLTLAAGGFRLSGAFETENGADFSALPNSGIRRDCLGGFCGLPEVDDFRFAINATQARFRMFDSFFINGLFELDFEAGTGRYSWQDDAFPFRSSGVAELSNIFIGGLPASPVPGSEGPPPPAVPLPASLPMLMLGFAGLWLRRRMQGTGSGP